MIDFYQIIRLEINNHQMMTLISLVCFLLVPGLTCPVIQKSELTLFIFSDTSFKVTGPIYPNGAFASAMNGNLNPNSYTGGMEIWETTYTSDSQNYKEITFTKTFNIPQSIKSATLYFNADDQAYFYLNDRYTNCFIDSWYAYGVKTCDLMAFVNRGSNSLKVVVINFMGPALISFRLEITMTI
jgi:hypothetical protein